MKELTPEFLEHLIGMRDTDAVIACQDMGFPYRTIRENGDWFLVTQDFKIDRVNFIIEDGKVIGACAG